MAAGRSKNAPSLDEVLDFLGLIWNVDHALQSLSKRMSSQSGITGPQRLVLRLIGAFPGSAAGQLAEKLHLHPSCLLYRSPSPRDLSTSLMPSSA